jgi:hypothetical protein
LSSAISSRPTRRSWLICSQSTWALTRRSNKPRRTS